MTFAGQCKCSISLQLFDSAFPKRFPPEQVKEENCNMVIKIEEEEEEFLAISCKTGRVASNHFYRTLILIFYQES